MRVFIGLSARICECLSCIMYYLKKKLYNFLDVENYGDNFSQKRKITVAVRWFTLKAR